jgi:putative membrane protein insertion efficiency factor
MKSEHLPVKAVVMGIRAYQTLLSPVIPRSCRFVPTCSDYAIEALKRYGIARGTVLAARRILRCHPLGGSGLDPVP